MDLTQSIPLEEPIILSSTSRSIRSRSSNITIKDLPTTSNTTINPVIIKKRIGRGKARVKPNNNNNNEGSKDLYEDCPICINVNSLKNKKKDLAVVWVECDKCETWYHWSCVSNPLDSIDDIDKWFCTPCISISLTTPTPLTTTYKIAPRKSLRETRPLDYANLNAHLPADVEKWMRVLETRITISGKFKIFKSQELNDDWLWGGKSFLEPFVVEEPEGLGMKMPSSDMGIQEIASVVGPTTPIEVIDVASQSSLSHWTLQQWANYYTDPKRDKVRNVISLEISESPLAPHVIAPEIVRKLSWVDNIWPQKLKGPGMYPTVAKYCLMSVARCWTDWHIDFAGSSVFYHILRGSKVFYFIEPTTTNLEAYEKWSGSSERQENTWLGDEVDVVYKIELTAGNTMIIPTGWIHAVYTPSDSLVFGGNFLHSLNIATQLRIYEIEIATKVPRKFRFPQFVKLLWFVAKHYNERLNLLLSKTSTLKKLSTSNSTPITLPIDLNQQVLSGLKTLTIFLLEQTNRFAKGSTSSNERKRISRESVPSEFIKDPVSLVWDLRSNILNVLGEKETEVEFQVERIVVTLNTSVNKKISNGVSIPSSSSPISTNGGGGNKRKRSSLSSSTLPPKANIKHLSSSTKPSKPLQPIRDDGLIISRNSLPVSITTRTTQLVDPERQELGLLWCEIRKTESNIEVVRRLNDVGNGGGGSGKTMEIRKVVTVVERVKWLEDGHGNFFNTVANTTTSTPVVEVAKEEIINAAVEVEQMEEEIKVEEGGSSNEINSEIVPQQQEEKEDFQMNLLPTSDIIPTPLAVSTTTTDTLNLSTSPSVSLPSFDSNILIDIEATLPSSSILDPVTISTNSILPRASSTSTSSSSIPMSMNLSSTTTSSNNSILCPQIEIGASSNSCSEGFIKEAGEGVKLREEENGEVLGMEFEMNMVPSGFVV